MNPENRILQSRWSRFLLGGLFVLVLALAFALHYAGSVAKQKIEAALGPNGGVGDVSVGLFSVEVDDLYIKAAPGWPTQDALVAKRVVVSPNWFSLFSDEIVLRKVRVDDIYLSAFRAKKGTVRMMFDHFKQEAKADEEKPRIHIRSFAVSEGVFEFFDAKVANPPYKVRLEDVELKATNLKFPDFKGVSQLDASAVLKGRTNGRVVLAGDMELASFDSDIKTTLRGMDLAALKPYLLADSHMKIQRGTLDLDMDSRIKQRRLQATGNATLHNLELESTGGLLSVPSRMAVAAMEYGKDDIQFRFTLNGGLDDPRFSVADSFAARFAGGLAEALGVGLGAAGGLVDTIKGWFK